MCKLEIRLCLSHNSCLMQMPRHNFHILVCARMYRKVVCMSVSVCVWCIYNDVAFVFFFVLFVSPHQFFIVRAIPFADGYKSILPIYVPLGALAITSCDRIAVILFVISVFIIRNGNAIFIRKFRCCICFRLCIWVWNAKAVPQPNNQVT